MKRLIVLLSALLLAVMPVQAKAQEQGDVTAKCYTEAGSVEGLEVSLYKVGDVSGGKLTFTDDYVGIKARCSPRQRSCRHAPRQQSPG